MQPDDATLDELDQRILARYQHDTQIAAHVIGRAVGLSAAAVQRRLKRLRRIGAIRREVAELSPDAVGLPITCVVGVDLDRESAREMSRFKQRMRERPEVQQCYEVTGQTDFILVALVPSMAAYEAFTRDALLADDNVKSFTTMVVLDRVKTGVAMAVQVRGVAPGPARRGARRG